MKLLTIKETKLKSYQATEAKKKRLANLEKKERIVSEKLRHAREEFSKIKTSGLNSLIILIASKNKPLREPSKPFPFPAIERSWQGNPNVTMFGLSLIVFFEI